MKAQTMILKFIKDDYEEYFERECNEEIEELCEKYNLQVTRKTFVERIHCLNVTLKKKVEVELVIK